MRIAFRHYHMLIQVTNRAPSRTPIKGLEIANQKGIVLNGIALRPRSSVSNIAFIHSAYCSNRPLRLRVSQVLFQNRIAGSHRSCS